MAYLGLLADEDGTIPRPTRRRATLGVCFAAFLIIGWTPILVSYVRGDEPWWKIGFAVLVVALGLALGLRSLRDRRAAPRP